MGYTNDEDSYHSFSMPDLVPFVFFALKRKYMIYQIVLTAIHLRWIIFHH